MEITETDSNKKRKKVLIFIPKFPNLTETFISREVSALVESSNLDVVVLALQKDETELQENLKTRTFYRRLTFFDCIKAFPSFFRLKRVFGALSLIVKNPNRSLIATLYILIKGVCYSKIFDEYSPDLILAHFMSESSTLALVISRMLNVPLAISAHAKDVMQKDSPKKDENAELIKQKVKNSKFVLICNKNALDSIKKDCDGIDSSNVYLQYHGLNFEALENADFTNLPPKSAKPTILFVGRFVEKKGLRYLIEASKILKDRGVENEVLLVGLGPLYEDMKSQISNLGLEDSVKIIGENKGLPFKEALKYYKIADLFVFPSIKTDFGDVDGIANVVVESAAYMLPVVATDAGSTQDLIINRKTGLIVSQRNPQELANAVEEMFKNPELAKGYAQNAYYKAREILNVKKNVKEIESFILDL